MGGALGWDFFETEEGLFEFFLGHICEFVHTLPVALVWLGIPSFDFGLVFVEDGSSVFVQRVGVVLSPLFLVGLEFILGFELEKEDGGDG